MSTKSGAVQIPLFAPSGSDPPPPPGAGVACTSGLVNPWGNARDEALSELLEEFAAGTVPSTAAAIEKRYLTLTANRAKKYRRRAKLEDQVAHHQLHEHSHPDQLDLAGLRQLVTLASAALRAEDQDLLLDVLGRGVPYREEAARRDRPIGTLKARVSRLCRQIRESQAGITIRTALAA